MTEGERERREAHITYREEGGGMKDKQRRLEKETNKNTEGQREERRWAEVDRNTTDRVR